MPETNLQEDADQLLEYEGPDKDKHWPWLVAEKRPNTREECILLEKEGDKDPTLLPGHAVAARGSKKWSEDWIKRKGKSTLSYHQYLSFFENVQGARSQVIASSKQAPNNYDSLDKTPDEVKFQKYEGSFHKLLEHDSKTGLLTANGVDNYNKLRDGLHEPAPPYGFNNTKFNSLNLLNRNPKGPNGEDLSPRVLINPQSSKAFSIKGPAVTSLDVSQICCSSDLQTLLNKISLCSDETAAEMIEVYAMALLRQYPLENYGDPQYPVPRDAQLALNALNSDGIRQAFQGPKDDSGYVTWQSLFRGRTKGDTQGKYLSVFLTFPRPPLFPSGCAPHVSSLIGASKFSNLGQNIMVPIGNDKDFGLTRENYVKIQNADVPEVYPDNHFQGELGLITTGRNLGEYVHVDNVYEQYIRAADILVGHQYNRSPNSPYTEPKGINPVPYYKNEGDGPTLGPSDAYGLLGSVRLLAERAAFTQKWLVARRARPEVMAALIDLAIDKGEGKDEEFRTLKSRLSPKLFDNEPVKILLERVSDWNKSRGGEKNYLLSQMYPEGSPAHPSWPSGHATVAGACVTVLKAIFDDTQCIIEQGSPPPPNLKCYKVDNMENPTAPPVVPTVAQELDKLASNIAFGRNFGGVHYRSDGEHGILLGEEVAIRFLQDHARTYREEFETCTGFTLTKRDGTRICITPNSVDLQPEPTQKEQPMTMNYSKSNL